MFLIALSVALSLCRTKDHKEQQIFSVQSPKYDAAYLELAVRKSAVLGTLDNNLSRACAKAGLQVI